MDRGMERWKEMKDEMVGVLMGIDYEWMTRMNGLMKDICRTFTEGYLYKWMHEYILIHLYIMNGLGE